MAGCLILQAPMAGAQERDAKNLPNAGGAIDPAFVGHYYLSGVMETGSELLLRADGSFEWYISYGALDQFAQGTWRREGEEIVLVAPQPPKNRPLFAYLDTEPWPAESGAENRTRRAGDRSQIGRRCARGQGGLALCRWSRTGSRDVR
ncbi:hypothetical protein NTCA1_15700 [Novosphingobium sp. TCA1]|nr:hypothetical protein NTCA1_15700 [Novosphingobium sp. TCA1]